MKFSLVMPTLNRTTEVERCLQSLARQTHKDFELVIVDQNKDGRLLDMIERYGKFYPIKRVESTTGASHARNVGNEHITDGAVVTWPDDDCWYPDNLLEHVNAVLEKDASLDGITGRFVDGDGREEGRWLPRSQLLNRYNVWRGAIEFSMFLRRPLIDRVGGFDEVLGVGANTVWGAGEGTDYLLRSINGGARILYDRDLVLHHPVKTITFDETARRRQRLYEGGFGRVIRRGGFPFWYFPAVCLRTLAGVTVALLRGRPMQARFKFQSLVSRIRGWRTGMSTEIIRATP